MNQQIQDYLVVNAINIFGQQIESDLIQLSQTKKELDGDITLVVFPFVKLLSILNTFFKGDVYSSELLNKIVS